MRRIVLMFGLAGILSAASVGEPVLARWAGGGENTMVEVRGFDAAGYVRLAPTDGAQGEALLPVTEVGDLRFVFSEAYQEARLRLSVGRPAEALYLLQQEMPAFVPYAILAESNVPAAVRLYLRLLQQNQSWPEAVAVGAALTQSPEPHNLTPDVLGLVQALARAERVEDATWLLGRIDVATDVTIAAAVERVATQLRRAGHWGEARQIYERLSTRGAAAPAVPWAALAAYCAWHQGHRDGVAELLETHANLAPPAWEGLLGLLRGHHALAAQDPVTALDQFGQALINAPADSEWRIEITAGLAAGYAALGRAELARRMQSELRELYPDSRWSLSLSPR